MRLALAPKVAVVEEGEVVTGEDEVVAVVTSHRHTTDRIQSYNISPNNLIFRKPEHENHLMEDSCHDISG